jgi:heme A synthase
MQTSVLFRRLSIVALLVTFGHLLFGNIVSGTDSGMGCGPHWPLCQGQLFPPLTDPALVIEWTHRLFAVLVGLSILATTLVAWRHERRFLGLAATSFVLVVVVGIFGGITVLLELHKAISTAHFALGTLLFALLVVLATKAYTKSEQPFDAPRGLHRWALASVILIYLQAVLGAYVRHSQAGMALPLWPFLDVLPQLGCQPHRPSVVASALGADRLGSRLARGDASHPSGLSRSWDRLSRARSHSDCPGSAYGLDAPQPRYGYAASCGRFGAARAADRARGAQLAKP